jgi:hypothetical protein
MSVRYNLFERWLGVGGGAVQVFFFLGSVVVSMVRFILVLAGGGQRGCTGFLLVLFVGFVFFKLLILF